MTDSKPNSDLSRYAAMGGKARAAALTPERRREIAMKAVNARWQKNACPPAGDM